MIMGIVIKYGFKSSKSDALNLETNNLSLGTLNKLPEYLHLTVINYTQSIFVYKFKNSKRRGDVNVNIHDYEGNKFRCEKQNLAFIA